MFLFFSRLTNREIFARVYRGTLMSSDGVHFVSLRSGALPRTLVFSCSHSCSSFSSRHSQGSQYPPPVAPLPAAPHSVPLVFLPLLSSSSLSSSSSSISSPLSISQASSYPRLVTTSSGTPFLRKTRSSTGIAARLKGQFRNFHSMAQVDRVSFLREIGVAPTISAATLYQSFSYAKPLLSVPITPEIPSVCCSSYITITWWCDRVQSRVIIARKFSTMEPASLKNVMFI